MRSVTARVLLALGLFCSPTVAEKAAAQESGSNSAAPPSEVEDDDPRIRRGLEVYHEQLCGICHRLEMAGTKGMFGPPHDGFAAIAAKRMESSTYTGSARTPAEYIRESIVDPTAHFVRGYESGFHQMPPYVDLAEEDLEALIQLLLLEE